MPITDSLPSLRTAGAGDPVIIRIASSADDPALARLAAMDSALPLRGAVLVAESGGVLRAALSLDDDRAVADPFVPTAGHVALLRTRASLLRRDRPRRGLGRRLGGRRRLLPAGG